MSVQERTKSYARTLRDQQNLARLQTETILRLEDNNSILATNIPVKNGSGLWVKTKSRNVSIVIQDSE